MFQEDGEMKQWFSITAGSPERLIHTGDMLTHGEIYGESTKNKYKNKNDSI